MNVPNRKQTESVRIEFDKETIKRINNGPLRITGGKGKTAWVRNLVMTALSDYENILQNRTQLDISQFPERKES